MKLHFNDEPELQFAGAGRHIDIQHGLTQHGPLDQSLSSAPQSVRLGGVEAAKDVELAHQPFIARDLPGATEAVATRAPDSATDR